METAATSHPDPGAVALSVGLLLIALLAVHSFQPNTAATVCLNSASGRRDSAACHEARWETDRVIAATLS